MYIKYYATEDIVPLNISMVGDDLSFTGSTISSIATDLSGIPNGSWITISGSVSNDGWAQLSADSTANSIIVSAALINELAGALITVTGYEHGHGEQYKIEIGVERASVKFSDNVTENKPLDVTADSEIIDFGTTETWSVTSTYFDYSQRKYWKEFRSSVRGGAQFEFDPYGTELTPIELMTSVMVPKKNVQFATLDQSLDMTALFTVEKVGNA